MSRDTPDLLLTDRTILAETMIGLRGARPASKCAKSAGIPSNIWRSWELCQNSPQPAQFSKILKGLGCTPEEFDFAIWEKMTERLADRAIMAFAIFRALEGPPETLRQALNSVLKEYANLFHGAAVQIESEEGKVNNRNQNHVEN